MSVPALTQGAAFAFWPKPKASANATSEVKMQILAKILMVKKSLVGKGSLRRF
jgi:hypothetical protein